MNVLLPSIGLCAAFTAAVASPLAPQADLSVIRQDAKCRQMLAECLVGGVPMLMMLDTGASHTVLHRESAAKLPNARKVDTSKMQINGNAAERPELLIADLETGGGDFRNCLMLSLDLQAVRSIMEEKIDGILGMDILSRLAFTLAPGSAASAGSHWGAPAPSPQRLVPIQGRKDAYGRLLTHAQCQGKKLEMLLDTGCTVSRVPLSACPAGTVGMRSEQIADIQGARVISSPCLAPADIELAPGVWRRALRPGIGNEGDTPLLGMDALEGNVMVHKPSPEPGGRFFFLPAPQLRQD